MGVSVILERAIRQQPANSGHCLSTLLFTNSYMFWIRRYLLSLIPLVGVGALILSAECAFKKFECATYGKEFLPCQAYGIDTTSFIIIGMYWAKIALPIVWFISVPWFLYVAMSQVESWWAARRKQSRPSA